MRAGGEYFLEPAEAVQRRYEALRCYFVEDASAESVGARFGYSPATVHQLAAELRAGRSSFFRSSKPGPKGSRKTHTIRDRVLVLRSADRSVTEIAQALTAQGDAVSAQTVWAILKSEGLERLARGGPAGPAPRMEQVPLEEHYVVSRSQRTRSVLTFFAQDHASTEMVYANADITKAEQAGEVIAFAKYWKRVAGADPGLLVFDSKLTTYPVLDELAARGITFLTLRQRGPKVLEALASLPASAWRTHNVKRAGRYRHPLIHVAIVHLKGIEAPLRQIAIRNIGHDQPTLLITNDLPTPAKDLFTRYAERMIIENELDADISGFHLNALSSGLPLNVDLDTTLSVLAGNCYRLLARKLPRYELATPDRLWRHFLDNTVADDHVRIDLALRTYTPVLIDAGFPELDIPIPWWGGRSLRFGFPPR